MAFHVSSNILSKCEYIFRHFAATMVILTIIIALFPVLLIFRLLAWVIVVIVIKWKNWGTSYYGKIISYGDACMDENFYNDVGLPPRMSIVATMTLEDEGQNLTLDQLRKSFIKNVLKATLSYSKRNKYKQRYPELQQYLGTLLGFRIWKQDPNFNIANHVVEQSIKFDEENKENEDTCVEQPKEINISKIHEELLNKPFQKDKSPWEIILLKPPKSECSPVLAFRMHHVLGDSTSFVQLFIECLSQKATKPNITKRQSSYLHADFELKSCTKALTNCLLFPFKHAQHMLRTLVLLFSSWSHPWKMVNYRSHKSSSNLVAWSPPMSAQDIQKIAKSAGVSSSAVIMGVCAGAIRECQEDVLGKKDVAVGYQLEKHGHPDFLANHSYLGILKLPTAQSCPKQRLDCCHKVLQGAKTLHLGKHLDFLSRLAGTFIPYPLTTYFTVNRFVPIAMSQIRCDAGANVSYPFPCLDFRICMGTYKGVAGVMLCACRYQDTVRIAVVANETVMERRQMEMLTDNVLTEMERLKTQSN